MIFVYYEKRNKDEKVIVKSISIQQKYSPVWVSKAIFHERTAHRRRITCLVNFKQIEIGTDRCNNRINKYEGIKVK